MKAWTIGGAWILADARGSGGMMPGLSLGAQGTFYAVGKPLRSEYGKAPWSVEVFLRVSPAAADPGMHGRGAI